MQENSGLQFTTIADIQQQSLISNMIAVQNLQEYLKYVILTTSVESRSEMNQHKILKSAFEQQTQLKDGVSMKNNTENLLNELKGSDNAEAEKSCCCTNSIDSSLSTRKRTSKLSTLFKKRAGCNNKRANTELRFNDAESLEAKDDGIKQSKSTKK